MPAQATIERIIDCLRRAQPGCYLRFGRADIDLALGPHGSVKEPTPERVSDMRRAFLLSGQNQLKSLEIECRRLGAGSGRGLISDTEALARLNAVGACFLETPVYSFGALRDESQADLLEQLFNSLKRRRPLLLYQVGQSPLAACKRLEPAEAITFPRDDELMNLEWLEQQARTATAALPGFPVIVMALGSPGRLLTARLLRAGFQGFILDLDDLSHVAFDPRPGRRIFSGLRRNVPTHVRKPRIHEAAEGGLLVRWEGPFLGNFSYSVINRELCRRIGSDGRVELTVKPSDTPFTFDAMPADDSPAFRSIVERVARPLSRPARIHVENHVQHPFRAPAEGRWVAIQPWDYMSLPVRWLDWIRTQVDEIWVPSGFVRQAYLDAGIDPERVAVVPNGVDTNLYRPDARKVKLNTRKGFRFLFVGGPFWRKGFDLLLSAYGRVFKAADDVSLVVKSVADFWTESGAGQLAAFRERAGAPEVLSIVQSLDAAHMAGLYANCNGLVHPYRAEGFAICVAEGMASGLPVIVTGSGGTSDYCNDQTAYLLPAQVRHFMKQQIDNEPTLDFPAYLEPEVDALAERMLYVYEHSKEARQIGRAGMEKVRAEFTWECAAERAVERLMALKDKPLARA